MRAPRPRRRCSRFPRCAFGQADEVAPSGPARRARLKALAERAALPRLPEPDHRRFERAARGRPAQPDPRADRAGQERRRDPRLHGRALRRLRAVPAAVQGDDACCSGWGRFVLLGVGFAVDHRAGAPAPSRGRRAAAGLAAPRAGRRLARGRRSTGAPAQEGLGPARFRGVRRGRRRLDEAQVAGHVARRPAHLLRELVAARSEDATSPRPTRRSRPPRSRSDRAPGRRCRPARRGTPRG